jgi:D-alanyl-D-alanine carboxypeptidase
MSARAAPDAQALGALLDGALGGRGAGGLALAVAGWVSHAVVASTPSELARFLHALLAGRLVGDASLRELTALVPVPRAQARGPWREPSYGLGVMADPASPLGPLLGHNGGGPGHGASAFAAPALRPGGATACAMVGLEEEHLAERLARAALACAAEPPIDRLDPW